MSRRLLCLLPLVLSLFLTACINDSAAYLIDGPKHALSVERKQDFFWEKQVQFSVIVSRLPDCQRKHVIQKASANASVELWQPGPGTFILRIGSRDYVTETRTCLGFAPLTEAPPNGFGRQLVIFEVDNGMFSFTPAPETEEEADHAETSS
jgi:hypothetical protein